jgi:hypothetical protein
MYLTNEVLWFEEYEHVRLSCRNYFRECSLWAAEGECKEDAGKDKSLNASAKSIYSLY